MSNPGNVDVVIGQTHVSGARLIAHSENLGSPISVPAGTVVGEGDSITVDGKPGKVANVIMDRIMNQADEAFEHINIYITPVEKRLLASGEGHDLRISGRSSIRAASEPSRYVSATGSTSTFLLANSASHATARAVLVFSVASSAMICRSGCRSSTSLYIFFTPFCCPPLPAVL